MPKGRKPQELYNPELIALIKEVEPSYKTTGRTRTQLVLKAQSLGIISAQQFEDSIQEKHTTVKCYLYTLVKDGKVRETLEQYVVAYSLLWWRCMAFLNLIANEVVGVCTEAGERVIWRKNARTQAKIAADRLYEPLFKTLTPLYIKQAFLPQKWTPDGLHPDILHFHTKYEEDLEHLMPSNWRSIMEAPKWDATLNHAATALKTCIQMKIRRAVAKNIKKYLDRLPGVEEEMKLYQLLNKPWPSELPLNVPDHLLRHMREIRSMLGLKNDEDTLKKEPTFSYDLFCFYLHMFRCGLVPSNIMPLGQFSRKFGWFDFRVLKNLLPSIYDEFKHQQTGVPNEDDQFMDYLGVSKRKFEERQNKKRKNLRKRARKTWGGHGGNKKQTRKRKKTREKKTRVKAGVHKKWLNKGTCRLPRGARVTSFESDGVSISLRVTYKPKLPPLYEEPYQRPTEKQRKERRLRRFERMREEDKAMGINPAFLGVDCGRAKMYYAASSRPPYSSTGQCVMTRSQYLHETKHKARQQWHQDKLWIAPELQEAYNALAGTDPKRDLLHYLAIQRQFITVLRRESIESKSEAFEKMEFYKHKTSSLSRAANRMINSGLQREGRLVVGLGDASFPSIGKGQIGVPVKGMMKALNQAKRRMEGSQMIRSHGPIEFVNINEFRTSKCCWRCGCICSEPRVYKYDKGKRPHGRKQPRKNEPDQYALQLSLTGTKRDRKSGGHWEKSTRLKFCPNCRTAEDRDFQASLNILHLTQFEYYGLPRPSHLSRQT